MNIAVMTFCRFLVLILLSVDWLEDPHFGQSRCSCVMTSTPAIADQQIKHQTMDLFDQNLHFPRPGTLPLFHLVELQQIETPTFLPAPCIPTLHVLMSLQQ